MVHEVSMGKHRKRMSFARSQEVLEMPNLIEVQKNSYRRFLEHDLMEVFEDVSPITDYNGNLELSFVGYTLDAPKDDLARCRERDKTYAAPLHVTARLKNKENGEAHDTDVYMGEFPLMTDTGTFLINGGERVVVSQLVRSPGVYFSMELDKHGKPLYSAQLIPGRGAWLEYEIDSNDVIWVKIDRHPKQELTCLIRALGYASNAEIVELFGEDEHLKKTMKRLEMPETVEAGLLAIYHKQKPGEPATIESATTLFHNLFFDSKRYDLMRVGRYKYNKKLALFSRIMRQTAAEDVINPMTGELMVAEGEVIDLETARAIQNSGINEVWVQVDSESGKRKVVGNNFGYPDAFLPFDPKEAGISDMVYLPRLVELLGEAQSEEELKKLIRENMSELCPKHILTDDIVASVSYLLGLHDGLGTTDDIDHLGNRRLRSVGELLQNQIRVGMTRMERTVRERMNTKETKDGGDVKAGDLINIRPITAAIKEFFGASQLSQFLDQPNPLAELTHKRRLSALGPGGLSRDRASFQVRDVHYSHYARICPIETPEGPNIGLIGSLATYARINEYGFIEAPYRRVDKDSGCVTDEIVYMTADEEDLYRIATANEPLNEDGSFVKERVMVRQRADYIEVSTDNVDFIDVSPRQVVSVATAMIPFLENDDATRALMGSNMQRQAVPLLVPEAPYVGTGMEFRAAHDSGVVILARENGVVEKVSGAEIVILDDFGERHTYKLTKFTRSNQSTCINQRPVVKAGQKVEKGDLLADGPSTEKGEIGLGRNALIGFMTWEGYNYEDAVLLSEELVKNDIYTSIHIEDFECEARETKLGPEEITRDIPNVGEDALRDLDEEGIVRIGAEVKAGDILVGKVTPKGETEPTAEERLLRAIFGEKACDVRDTSLRVPHGEGGIVVDVKIFTRENHDEVSPGVNKLVRIYLAQKRKISVGDKMSGRHGNKGVVSRILREEDMPFLPDGTPLQIVLNPMGVPSRMNIGQVMEVHLGMACRALGWHIATPVFDGATYDEIRETLRKAGLREDGKAILRDGRTGDEFENPVTVGVMYFLKLHHLVDDKMHARSTGPYALVTQQPLGGKAQFGGQRFGEMEVWALEAYGAAHTLQEILTVKSDDVVGRVKTYEAIIKGQNIPDPRVPESFKVLVKELQALCLDIKVLDQDGQVVEIPELDPDDMNPPEANRPAVRPVEAEEGEGGEPLPEMPDEDLVIPGDEDFPDFGMDEGFMNGEDLMGFGMDQLNLDDDDDLIE